MNGEEVISVLNSLQIVKKPQFFTAIIYILFRANG